PRRTHDEQAHQPVTPPAHDDGPRRCGLSPSERVPDSPPHGHHRADTLVAQVPACLLVVVQHECGAR
ncbi:MAG TPA: hypothetical protein VHS32_10070, partial [Streptosporangiaceae bacterium]|nr:hypothetical protein [Streptosporangiaceae bacterium]